MHPRAAGNLFVFVDQHTRACLAPRYERRITGTRSTCLVQGKIATIRGCVLRAIQLSKVHDDGPDSCLLLISTCDGCLLEPRGVVTTAQSTGLLASEALPRGSTVWLVHGISLTHLKRALPCEIKEHLMLVLQHAANSSRHTPPWPLIFLPMILAELC